MGADVVDSYHGGGFLFMDIFQSADPFRGANDSFKYI